MHTIVIVTKKLFLIYLNFFLVYSLQGIVVPNLRIWYNCTKFGSKSFILSDFIQRGGTLCPFTGKFSLKNNTKKALSRSKLFHYILQPVLLKHFFAFLIIFKSFVNYILIIFLYYFTAVYLSEAGVDCEATCKQVNDSFGCFNRINTHESVYIFETARDPTNYTIELDITCKPSTDSVYARTLHPSYDITTQECKGYLDAPMQINCTTEETIDTNTRRICYCVDIGKKILSKKPFEFGSMNGIH